MTLQSNSLMGAVDLIQHPWPNHCDHIINSLEIAGLAQQIQHYVLDIRRIMSDDEVNRLWEIVDRCQRSARESDNELAEMEEVLLLHANSASEGKPSVTWSKTVPDNGWYSSHHHMSACQTCHNSLAVSWGDSISVRPIPGLGTRPLTDSCPSIRFC